jgi:hypothetical protein
MDFGHFYHRKHERNRTGEANLKPDPSESEQAKQT